MRDITQQDIAGQNQELLAKLREAREEYLECVSRIPEDACRVRPREDAWSILECAEHVVLAERGMLFAVQNRRPTNAPPDLEKDKMIQNILDDRTRKASAPELSRPTGRYPNLAAAIKDFESAREQTLAFVQENKDDLRRYTVKHPFGIFDAYQVLTIMALHPLRHVRQIDAIRQNVEAGTGGKTQTAV